MVHQIRNCGTATTFLFQHQKKHTDCPKATILPRSTENCSSNCKRDSCHQSFSRMHKNRYHRIPLTDRAHQPAHCHGITFYFEGSVHMYLLLWSRGPFYSPLFIDCCGPRCSCMLWTGCTLFLRDFLILLSWCLGQLAETSMFLFLLLLCHALPPKAYHRPSWRGLVCCMWR